MRTSGPQVPPALPPAAWPFPSPPTGGFVATLSVAYSAPSPGLTPEIATLPAGWGWLQGRAPAEKRRPGPEACGPRARASPAERHHAGPVPPPAQPASPDSDDEKVGALGAAERAGAPFHTPVDDVIAAVVPMLKALDARLAELEARLRPQPAAVPDERAAVLPNEGPDQAP